MRGWWLDDQGIWHPSRGRQLMFSDHFLRENEVTERGAGHARENERSQV
jgi:hypothetical protein